jgi:hypothetical protein
MAKVQAIAVTTKAKVQAKQMADQQKLQQKEQAFRQKQSHEIEKTRADIFVKGMEGVTEAHATHSQKSAETRANVKAIKAQSDAQAEAARKKADASPSKY